jgi:hypothetical protein
MPFRPARRPQGQLLGDNQVVGPGGLQGDDRIDGIDLGGQPLLAPRGPPGLANVRGRPLIASPDLGAGQQQVHLHRHRITIFPRRGGQRVIQRGDDPRAHLRGPDGVTAGHERLKQTVPDFRPQRPGPTLRRRDQARYLGRAIEQADGAGQRATGEGAAPGLQQHPRSQALVARAGEQVSGQHHPRPVRSGVSLARRVPRQAAQTGPLGRQQIPGNRLGDQPVAEGQAVIPAGDQAHPFGGPQNGDQLVITAAGRPAQHLIRHNRAHHRRELKDPLVVGAQ